MLARAKLTRQGGHRVEMSKNGQRNESNLHFIDFSVSDEFLLRALVDPKSDDLKDETTCENEPRNGNDHDLQVAGGFSVTVNARILTEESSPIVNDVRTGE